MHAIILAAGLGTRLRPHTHLTPKPMIKIENDDLIAIASEEVSLNRLFPGRALDTSEPAPGTYDTWQKST
jgi:2-C-methyl-D-erythritol 4-phosphate cytidylyltransferase